MAKKTSGERKNINLALQGGGAHGAFTWGVLDYLLEDGRLRIGGVSGASAGAMNAVVLADGMYNDGEQGARNALRKFWRGVSDAAHLSPLKRTPLDAILGNWSLDHSPGYLFFDLWSRIASPYDFNPMDINPLRELLADLIDFERVRRCADIKLFISATNVETGQVKVFVREEMTVERVLASACLPFLFQAVEIDGAPYWDGGYMGNPPLFPLFRACESDDILVVQINPIKRVGAPRTAREILNRMNEITFNGSLMKEFRAIAFVRRLIEEGSLTQGGYHKINVHMVHGGEDLKSLQASSKLNAEWPFLLHLFEIGRQAAANWLDENYDKIGVQSSVDLRALFNR